MTVKEFLEVYSDLDAYMARGGRLLDLELIPLEELPLEVQEYIALRLGRPQLEPLRRFFSAVIENPLQGRIRQGRR